jgi:hypothetical protein
MGASLPVTACSLTVEFGGRTHWSAHEGAGSPLNRMPAKAPQDWPVVKTTVTSPRTRVVARFDSCHGNYARVAQWIEHLCPWSLFPRPMNLTEPMSKLSDCLSVRKQVCGTF